MPVGGRLSHEAQSRPGGAVPERQAVFVRQVVLGAVVRGCRGLPRAHRVLLLEALARLRGHPWQQQPVLPRGHPRVQRQERLEGEHEVHDGDERQEPDDLEPVGRRHPGRGLVHHVRRGHRLHQAVQGLREGHREHHPCHRPTVGRHEQPQVVCDQRLQHSILQHARRRDLELVGDEHHADQAHRGARASVHQAPGDHQDVHVTADAVERGARAVHRLVRSLRGGLLREMLRQRWLRPRGGSQHGSP
mmetsp:Transcript_92147/g.265904  ORF Transcript_92147/g.265904 Transcript_92147/m.265904 type:complete len:247 (-) Transcript_92147:25-765(-)